MWTRAFLLTAVACVPVLVATGPAQADRDDHRSRSSVAIRYEQSWGDRDRDRGRGWRDDGPREVIRYEKVLVAEGYTRRVWVPPVYECRRDPCGREYRVLVREGYYREECVPARYEYREVRCAPPPPPCPPPRPRCDDRSGISIVFKTRW
jgi:hypothetical protein